MTRCADCRGPAEPNGRIYVLPSGERAKTLCQDCQTNYPRKRQYRPRHGPTRTTYRITEDEP